MGLLGGHHMQELLDYASFAPHGYCLLWNPWLIAIHVVADLLIVFAYFAIPVALVLFLRRRPELRYRGLVALFAAFIVLCGMTHLLSLATLWIPVYTAEGILKLFTGIVSATTAVVLFRLIPQLVAIPSPHDLASANARLQDEIAAHKETLADLRDAQRTLETKVEQRTQELTAATQQLSVLSREAVHRSRNLLTVVASIARQTARGATDNAVFVENFLGRIEALSNATAALIGDSSSTSVTMERLAARQLKPVVLTFGDRLRIEGRDVEVNPQAAQQLSLVLHELATNSQKHGTLSQSEGSVDVRWDVVVAKGVEDFVLTWREHGGARHVGSMSKGFGSALLLKIAPMTLGGEAEASLSEGFRYSLTVPMDAIIPKADERADAEELARKIVDEAWGRGPVIGT